MSNEDPIARHVHVAGIASGAIMAAGVGTAVFETAQYFELNLWLSAALAYFQAIGAYTFGNVLVTGLLHHASKKE